MKINLNTNMHIFFLAYKEVERNYLFYRVTHNTERLCPYPKINGISSILAQIFHVRSFPRVD